MPTPHVRVVAPMAAPALALAQVVPTMEQAHAVPMALAATLTAHAAVQQALVEAIPTARVAALAHRVRNPLRVAPQAPPFVA